MDKIMNRAVIKEQIIKIINENTLNKENNKEIKSLINDTDLDSIQILDLIIEIQDIFNFEFDISDDFNVLMNDIDVLADYIYKKVEC